MDLRDRCKKFISELNIPVTNFCRNVNIAPSSYYRWQKNEFKLSTKRAESIDQYLQKYNF